ncbi:helix-turn-helix domain-containing protein, partial [Catenulispora sp. NF23]|uniref:helix-turn-helix domain-containing protein n=1 Tax=Catenulispora pinistramenti TaxID=2705254 RepID=UPI001BA9A1AD
MARHTDDFAARLRTLKDRSRRSYGALAQRLHTSTSTLHRYCNGTTVPAEFAPAERFARACGATPDEVLALHRLWLLADAERRAEAAAGRGASASASTGEPAEGSGTDTSAASEPAGPSTAEVAQRDDKTASAGGQIGASNAGAQAQSSQAPAPNPNNPASWPASEHAPGDQPIASSPAEYAPSDQPTAFSPAEHVPSDQPIASSPGDHTHGDQPTTSSPGELSDQAAASSPGAPIVISPGTRTESPRPASRWLKPALAGLAAAAVLVPLAIYATHDSGTSASRSAGATRAGAPSTS